MASEELTAQSANFHKGKKKVGFFFFVFCIFYIFNIFVVIAAQQVTYRLLNAFVAIRSSASQSSSSQFPLEKVCQGEDDSLINYILSASPLDNKRKCVHSLLLHLCCGESFPISWHRGSRKA